MSKYIYVNDMEGDLYILIGAMVAGAHPNFIVAFSIKPHPPQTKSRGKLV
jgi:hypothetical protein